MGYAAAWFVNVYIILCITQLLNPSKSRSAPISISMAEFWRVFDDPGAERTHRQRLRGWGFFLPHLHGMSTASAK
jgi:hypothetical protein